MLTEMCTSVKGAEYFLKVQIQRSVNGVTYAHRTIPFHAEIILTFEQLIKNDVTKKENTLSKQGYLVVMLDVSNTIFFVLSASHCI